MVIAAWLAGTTTAAAQAGTAALSGTIKDEQGGALPGVTVTATNTAGLVRSASTDETGTYHLLALPPGEYDVRAELSGFRTAVREKLPLPVDVTTRFDVQMAIGALTETISVHGEVSPINVSDASLGNVISGSQVRALPLEANNVNGLLSLQPGAVYVPNAQVSDSRTGAVLNIDPRSGSVSGARADQSNITLDGIDVNDPQFGTAYASALRMTLDSLQEFRVSTSNYGAEAGRSSGPQVSLVTRSGTNDFHGSANWVQRDTRFSSNAYFLKLAQLEAGEPSEAPKLDKKIFGGSFGGPIAKDKLFFFGNYERLNEDSEAPVLRDVPSLTMRDGVLVYPCAIAAECPGGSVRGFNNSHSIAPGNYGLSPGSWRCSTRWESGRAAWPRTTSASSRTPTTRASTASTWSAIALPRRSRTRSTPVSAGWTTGCPATTRCLAGSTSRMTKWSARRSSTARRRTRRERSRAAAWRWGGTRCSPRPWSTLSATA